MPEQVNVFVFRTDADPFVKEELRMGRLRQGWSPPGTSLLNDDGSPRTKEEWVNAYRNAWREDPSPRRWRILLRMLDMKEGDLVVCPKMSDNSCFTIATVSGPYRFEETPCQDFGHIIPVKDQREVKNWYDSDAQTIHELFKSAYFRSAVTKVQDSNRGRVLEAARRLREREDTGTAQDPDAIRKERYAEAKRAAAKHLIKYFNECWGFDQFEAVVGEAFERKGYERIRGKSQHGGGSADADHVFSMPMPGFDDLDNVNCPLYLLIVQVKHKKEEDYNDVQGVRQLIDWKPSEGEQVVSQVLFSSAASFTKECKRLAEKNDVTLICGEEAGLFML